MNARQLDAWRNPATDVRILVEVWDAQTSITNQFIARPKSARMVWNYLGRYGPRVVWRKIRSRLAEQGRNTKAAGIGTGWILEAPAASGLAVGQRVLFLAPNHSPGWPRLSLDMRLLVPADPSPGSAHSRDRIEFPEALREIVGWSPYSGRLLDAALVKRELLKLVPALPQAPSPRTAEPRDPTGSERRLAGPVDSGKPTAVVFGLGNYAKTQIIPHIRQHLHLATVHEVDPDQIDAAATLGATLDTSPLPRPDEHYDAWFIAGYHETHAALAIHALKDGAYAVVEKPLVTTRSQFSELTAAMVGAASRRVFTCFHRRYSMLDRWAREDLGTRPGDSVDMHSIVYEIPLPALHWYNWPRSGSRLVSNGCHWLDYFLHVNAYSPVVERDVRPLRDSDLAVFARLENGAQLTLTLTDTGSERLGVRDVIELRAADVTVRLIDATYYDAERTSRVLRRRRVNPMNAYALMYDSIGRSIAAGRDGDSVDSLRSTALMLDLEDELRRKLSIA